MYRTSINLEIRAQDKPSHAKRGSLDFYLHIGDLLVIQQNSILVAFDNKSLYINFPRREGINHCSIGTKLHYQLHLFKMVKVYHARLQSHRLCHSREIRTSGPLLFFPTLMTDLISTILIIFKNSPSLLVSLLSYCNSLLLIYLKFVIKSLLLFDGVVILQLE